MDLSSFDGWLQQIFNAGPQNQEAINSLHAFVETPEALSVILNAISSGNLSKNSLLISLSCIPRCKIISADQFNYVKEWFSDFCFKRAEFLIDDSLISLLVNIFIFLYENDQRTGSDLIQKLADSGPNQCILSLQISTQIILKAENSNGLAYLIPVATIPFSYDESSDRLIDSAAFLLKTIISKKTIESQHYPLIIMREFLRIGFPRRLFYFIHKFNGSKIPEHLFILLTELLKFPNSSFATQSTREEFVFQTINELINYITKFKIPETEYSSIAILLTTLKSIVSKEKQFNAINQEFLIIWIQTIANLTLQLIDPSFLISSTSPAEFILDFWRDPINKGFISSQEEDKARNVLQDAVIKIFFSQESVQNQNLIYQILSDETSLFMQKFVSTCKFNEICSISECISNSLSYFIEVNSLLNAAFCIEFFAYAIRELVPYANKVMDSVVGTSLKLF
ncbi:hypothetical protein GPJ56_007540 [Histomonas meleagridis]|uniref:uncharacterized protein n=1 Tax=Histomonas meleagridis TaxID=135588 RepID=UPI00355A1BFD|nr:hypothetical protein GPJ56_007540 [Histomonas meleagridis]KAH0806059.1 hypothetical protein GO595_001072 [Histomonas meleagridis]